jgi:hypothetical protein
MDEFHSLPLKRVKINAIFKGAILSIFVIGNFLNMQAGWADNGDFTRIMSWFTSGPVQLENWPPRGTEAWNQRFFYYWIPYWKLDFPQDSSMFVSAVLLWFPGVVLNRFFFSAYTLYLPFISLAPRLAMFIFLWLALLWIDARSKHPTVFYLTLALPLVALFTTTDVVAFYNSFFQETGAIVFFAYLVVVIVLGQWGPRDWRYYLLAAISVLLMTSSKSASFYWPFLSLPFVVPFFKKKPRIWLYLASGAVVSLLIAYIGMTVTHYATPYPYREYNSLFGGTLLLSKAPAEQLARLGMPDAVSCIGVDVYSSAGNACLQKYQHQISYLAVVRTIVAEPAILVRQVDVLTHMMQNYSLELGKYVFGDPVVRQETRLNFWSVVKDRIFPKGWALVGAMPVFLVIMIFGKRLQGLPRDLVPVAWVCMLALWIDMFVEILGDGQRDLLKHLVMPNMFFDFLLIAVVNIAVGLLIARFFKPSSHPNPFVSRQP